ncbi:hypothetical protein C8R44DRAFT_741564 [Mycena epipterygia]|nr:hypothetical protein C8R44DRAFT_741564 [Mycena epipterygia]
MLRFPPPPPPPGALLRGFLFDSSFSLIHFTALSPISPTPSHSRHTTPPGSPLTHSFTCRISFASCSGYSDREEADGVQRTLEHVGKARCQLVYVIWVKEAGNVARHIRAAGSRPKHK